MYFSVDDISCFCRLAVAYTLYFYYLHVSTLEVRMAHSDVSLQSQADGQHDGT